MKYKVEVIVQGRVVRQGILRGVTQPGQAVRRILAGTNYDFAKVLAMNEEGQAWVYFAKRRGSGYIVEKENKFGRMIPRQAVWDIMAGNVTINRVIGG